MKTTTSGPRIVRIVDTPATIPVDLEAAAAEAEADKERLVKERKAHNEALIHRLGLRRGKSK